MRNVLPLLWETAPHATHSGPSPTQHQPEKISEVHLTEIFGRMFPPPPNCTGFPVDSSPARLTIAQVSPLQPPSSARLLLSKLKPHRTLLTRPAAALPFRTNTTEAELKTLETPRVQPLCSRRGAYLALLAHAQALLRRTRDIVLQQLRLPPTPITAFVYSATLQMLVPKSK